MVGFQYSPFRAVEVIIEQMIALLKISTVCSGGFWLGMCLQIFQQEQAEIIESPHVFFQLWVALIGLKIELGDRRDAKQSQGLQVGDRDFHLCFC